MNSPLAREDAEKHAGARSCSYCNKVFTNYRALGGHLRIHQEGKTSGTLNYLGSSSNSIETTGNPPASLPNSQRNSSPGVNNQTPISRATPIYSNETNPANMTGFTSGNTGVAQTQIIMFPIYSYTCGSAATSHPSSLASGGSAPTGTDAAMSHAAFASSNSLVGTDFHIDTSLHLGPNEVCQFNTDEFQISPDGLPPTRGDALQNVQGYNIGPPPSSSPDKAGQNDCRCLVRCENVKRPYLADESGKTDVTNASKKPIISPNAHAEPEEPMIVRNAHVESENIGKRELPLFVDFDYSVPAPKACFGAEKGPEDVDLSLHL
ncbi:hypothetical protein HRI_002268900 [Hibiscus trionum]|uniref:C2H2-type domain-containing protein n=1 Tax=Hibiscus trionum TaxID=183268 RepID=A0A9W7HZ30_HIBTR|nr:hypothetical protein HRI_002268900 [Hibiscus trionum]